MSAPDHDRWLVRYYRDWRKGRGPGWYLVDADFEEEPRGPYRHQDEAIAEALKANGGEIDGVAVVTEANVMAGEPLMVDPVPVASFTQHGTVTAPDAATVQLTMPGKVYDSFCSRDVSNVPDEEGWPRPTSKRQGFGTTVTYEGITADQVEAIISHVEEVASNWADFGSDNETRAAGRAGMAWAAKERAR